MKKARQRKETLERFKDLLVKDKNGNPIIMLNKETGERISKILSVDMKQKERIEAGLENMIFDAKKEIGPIDSEIQSYGVLKKGYSEKGMISYFYRGNIFTGSFWGFAVGVVSTITARISVVGASPNYITELINSDPFAPVMVIGCTVAGAAIGTISALRKHIRENKRISEFITTLNALGVQIRKSPEK